MQPVDYDSHSSLVSILQGQDALIITQSFTAPPNLQTKIIAAALEAGVPWILPNEYGSDTNHSEINKIPVNGAKKQYREQIESSKNSAFIAIVTNPWYEFSLLPGFYGIDVKNRTATLYDDGEFKADGSTMVQVGRAVAKVLSLPITSTDGSPSLSDYRNDWVYIRSFNVSQRDILAAVQRATKTSPDDWKVSSVSGKASIQEGLERFQNGDFMGLLTMLFGSVFSEGHGGDYGKTKGVANSKLNLPEEELDDITEKELASAS